MNNRILGIDPGDKRIGLAISDETGTIANPLSVLQHISRAENARRIVGIVHDLDAASIVIGRTLNEDGEVSFQGRKSERLKQAILDITEIPVDFWNEDFSTNQALESRQRMGVKKKKRKGHLDEIAATIILQGYLDYKKANQTENKVES
ncbi:MAG: Holliday junction resolvase RuvX [Anaerolineaceae bacterium]|nr:Holliday junction resolvase RuvX [Anaerolineaceae bacterium]